MLSLDQIGRELEARVSGPEGAILSVGSRVVTHDARRSVPGGIFVAIRGARTDGNRFVDQAVARGVVAIISEEERPQDYRGVWLQVANARLALARAAALVHGDPSTKLRLIGITGTNGKTTTTWIVDSILRAAGSLTAVMGTIGYRIGDEVQPAEHTTPESPEIQDFLRRALIAGAGYAVMEVSSIGLEMHRADHLSFAVAGFTNLTQDHLDFHGTMEAYFAAKLRLFDGSIGRVPEQAVINLDDPRGSIVAGVSREKGSSVLTFALDGPADITASEAVFDIDGLRLVAKTPAGKMMIESPLVGRPHASNILCALGIGLALGIDPEAISYGIAGCRGVAGRFERVSSEVDDIRVIVDYAHTPDALASVLQTIARVNRNGGAIRTVFGCGGDRDRTKRPLMGEEAGRGSDHVIITSDNPRSEDPLLIMNDIRLGLGRVGRQYELIIDRKEAIFSAITAAKSGDIVLIAGKGHENYQIIGSERLDFDDREVARQALSERRIFRERFPGGTVRSGSR